MVSPSSDETPIVLSLQKVLWENLAVRGGYKQALSGVSPIAPAHLASQPVFSGFSVLISGITVDLGALL